MFLRQLEYLAALARERHFGRAAQACHVSQPSLSAAVRKLELELGIPLVLRGHRYDDLTPEGQALLPWAQQAIDSIDRLTSEATRLRGHLTGTLRLGVIPTALPAISLVTRSLLETHPEVGIKVISMSSVEIGRGLAAHELDAGVTYLDNEPLGDVAALPLYRERYLFLTSDPDVPGRRIAWADLAGRPLCLLTPDMQNRRIVDAALADAGVASEPQVQADSISALLSFARTGWSCVVAHTWIALNGAPEGVRALELREPDVTHEIGLVTPSTEPLQPIVRALREELAGCDIVAALDRLTQALSLV